MFNRSFTRVLLPAALAGLATAFVVGCSSDSSKSPAGPSAIASLGTRATAPGSGQATIFGAAGRTQNVHRSPRRVRS